MRLGTISGVGLAAAAMSALSGCVCPGPIDSGLVARYQRAMTHRAPQPRQQEAGLGSLLPEATGPELKVTVDPQTGKAQIDLTLEEAVQRALANGLEIKVVSFDPAISREEMIQAAAEFDWIVYGGISYTKQDVETDSAFGGGQNRARVLNAGIKKKTITGGTAELDWSWTRSWSDLMVIQTAGVHHEPTLNLQITQPLLRDGGVEVNLATLRIARLNHTTDLSKFRQRVEEIVSQVVGTYWGLVQARLELVIQLALLKRTEETLDRIRKRQAVDATDVQIKQAEAAVESRKARVIRARKVILDVQDQLGQLLADKQINVLSQYEIIPTTDPVREKIGVSATDQLVTALRRSPLLEQARLAIDVADINVRVARNQTLPRLDLTASTGLQGLASKYHQAQEDMYSGHYLSYAVGLALEYPIGNRYARAALRQSRFQRLQAITSMQNVADQVAVSVNERVRQINTTYEEMKAQQAAVAAARRQLQALEDTEQIRGQLTPAFLQTKLTAQELLANAETAELTATVQYNTAWTDLARITGAILDQYHVEMERTLQKVDLEAFKRPIPAKLPQPVRKP